MQDFATKSSNAVSLSCSKLRPPPPSAPVPQRPSPIGWSNLKRRIISPASAGFPPWRSAAPRMAVQSAGACMNSSTPWPERFVETREARIERGSARTHTLQVRGALVIIQFRGSETSPSCGRRTCQRVSRRIPPIISPPFGRESKARTSKSSTQLRAWRMP